MAIYAGCSNENIMDPKALDFTINPSDRSITYIVWNETSQEYEAGEKFKLMQYDSKSTKLVFDIPRYIQTHDMLECNLVQIHYLNSGDSTGQEKRDIHNILDLAPYTKYYKATLQADGTYIKNTDSEGNAVAYTYPVSDKTNVTKVVTYSGTDFHTLYKYTPLDEEGNALTDQIVYFGCDEKDENGNAVEELRFSWDITNHATSYAGTVQFVVHFMCTTAGQNITPGVVDTYGVVKYKWSTGICYDIQVIKGMNNNNLLSDESLDVIAGFNELVVPHFEWIEDLTLDETDPEYGEKNILQITRQFDGTIIESTSLKGPTGNDGVDGSKGDKGDKGDQGEIGVTPQITVGEVGYVTVEDPEPKITVDNTDPANPVMSFTLPNPPNDHIETIDGTDVWFFQGTKAEYEEAKAKLIEEKGEDVFNNMNIMSVITDEIVDEEIINGTLEIAEIKKDIDNINTNVVTNTNHISNLDNRVNELERVGAATIHNYGWNKNWSLSDPQEITFPMVDDTWDEFAVYEYFNIEGYDEDGNEILVPANVVEKEYNDDNIGFVNTEIVPKTTEYFPFPSACSFQWWSRADYNSVPTSALLRSPGYHSVFSCYDKTLGDGSFYNFPPVSERKTFVIGSNDIIPYVNCENLYLNIDGKTVSIKIGGGWIAFDNLLIDDINPDKYDGDGIRREIKASIELDKTGIAQLIIETRTWIYVKGIQNSGWDYLKHKFCNKVLEFNYDPQNKYPEVTKCKKYTYAIGAPKLKTTIQILSGDGMYRPSLSDNSSYSRFSVDITDYLKYLKTISPESDVKRGDYLLDGSNDLFQILSSPYPDDNDITRVSVVRLTRGDVTGLKEMYKSIYTIEESYVDEIAFSSSEFIKTGNYTIYTFKLTPADIHTNYADTIIPPTYYKLTHISDDKTLKYYNGASQEYVDITSSIQYITIYNDGMLLFDNTEDYPDGYYKIQFSWVTPNATPASYDFKFKTYCTPKGFL